MTQRKKHEHQWTINWGYELVQCTVVGCNAETKEYVVLTLKQHEDLVASIAAAQEQGDPGPATVDQDGK